MKRLLRMFVNSQIHAKSETFEGGHTLVVFPQTRFVAEKYKSVDVICSFSLSLSNETVFLSLVQLYKLLPNVKLPNSYPTYWGPYQTHVIKLGCVPLYCPRRGGTYLWLK